jgi:single-strand DNA-binding protein
MFIGRLTKDPEMSYTTSGTPVVKFTVAVQRNFKNAEGDYDADFIQCVAWRGLAELIGNRCKKGNKVGCGGRIQTRTYEDDGRTVFVSEVNVEDFSYLEPWEEKGGYSPDAPVLQNPIPPQGQARQYQSKQYNKR